MTLFSAYCLMPKVSDATATIHIRVSREQKGRWVRESRAAGLRLSDWIANAINAQHPAYCQLCEHDVTPIRDEMESVCPKCKLVL